MPKKAATSIRITPEAKDLLAKLSDKLGISQASILEILIRDKAKREKITPPRLALVG